MEGERLATRLEKYNEEACRYEVEEWFVPIELAWCHGSGNQLPALNPHATIYFDLGHSAREDPHGLASGLTQFVLKTSPIDARQSAYTLNEGLYQLRIQSRLRTPNRSRLGSISDRSRAGPTTLRISFVMVTCASLCWVNARRASSAQSRNTSGVKCPSILDRYRQTCDSKLVARCFDPLRASRPSERSPQEGRPGLRAEVIAGQSRDKTATNSTSTTWR